MSAAIVPFIPKLGTAMTQEHPEKLDRSYENRLYPEDQKRVDEFVSRGINSVERKPFRPMRLLILLIVVVASLSVFSQLLVRWAGVY
jgi:hypothetical protein